MFSTDEFGGFTERVIPLAHITTQVEGDPDQGLLGEKGGQGFPTLAFLDAAGRLLAKPRGRSVEAFAATLDEDVPAFLAMEEAAESGDAEAKQAYFLKQIELGHIEDFAAAYKQLDALELDDAVAKKKRDELAGWEFNLASSNWRSGNTAEAATRLQAMVDGDRIPGGRNLLNFWYVYSQVAVESEDAKKLEAAIEALEEVGGRRTARLIDQLKEELAKLKEELAKLKG
ncbi:MAG: hypothetical protein AAF196_12470 [Planctomycetota bacterium]